MSLPYHLSRFYLFTALIVLYLPYNHTFAKPVALETQQYDPDLLLVKIHKPATLDFLNFKQRYRLKRVEKLGQKPESTLSNWFKVYPDHSINLNKLKSQLENDPQISQVAFNFYMETTATLPNDPLFQYQWALNHEERFLSSNNWDISATRAWDIRTDTETVIVAVLDTGVDYSHEDLQDNMWVNQAELNGKDNFDDDNNGCVDDIYGCDVRSKVRDKLGYYPGIGGAYYRKTPFVHADDMGHGTMVAGIIGAVGNNGIGIAGVSWNIKIMSVKMIYPNNVASLADAAVAIEYAVDNGAKIINNSYGKSHVEDTDHALLEDAIEYANQHGVLVIASAGNTGVDIDTNHSFYPANSSADNLITVTAINQENTLWEHSNYGRQSVDIAAPGVAIWSTVPAGNPTLFRKFYDPSGYMITEGTSVAAPYVSGVAAMLFSHYPQMDYIKVKQIILETVDRMPSLTEKTVSGGRVNLYNALTYVQAPD